MGKATLELVKVYSPIEDKGIRNNLIDSPIWTGLRYTESELAIAQKKHTELYEYSIKFEGLKPIQVAGVKKLIK